MSPREKTLLLILGGAALLYLLARSSGGQLIAANITDRIAKLITGEEGERLTVYQDTGGAWTIGKGHLVRPGERFYPYGAVRSISKAESDALFVADTKNAHDAVSFGVKVPLNDNQFAALVSLVFNIGIGAFNSSTLLKRLNARDYAGAAAEFDRWIYDNGQVNASLAARRNREQQIFNA